MTSPYYTQSDFQGYADDDVPGSATVKAGINNNWTQGVDENFRIRFAVEESNNKAAKNPSFGLEYNLAGGGWTAVNQGTPSVLKCVATSHYADTDADNNQRVSSGGTFTGGELDDDNALGEVLDFVGNDICEYETCLQIIGADVSDAQNLQIRVAGLNDYTNTTSLTISKAASNLTINVNEALGSSEALD